MEIVEAFLEQSKLKAILIPVLLGLITIITSVNVNVPTLQNHSLDADYKNSKNNEYAEATEPSVARTPGWGLKSVVSK